MTAGKHGSTFGGNPLACSAANSVIEQIQQHDLCKRTANLGNRLIEEFTTRLSSNTAIKQIRGIGLMIGIELKQPCSDLVGYALDEKLLISIQRGNTIRLLPPLITTDQEAITLVETLCSVIDKYTRVSTDEPSTWTV